MSVKLTGNYRVTKILKKTRAEGFCDLKEGDGIYMEVVVKNNTGSRGLYATDITVKLIYASDYTLKTITKSMSQLKNILNNFELEETGWNRI